MNQITLNNIEQQMAIGIALGRQSYNTKNNIKEHKIGDRDAWILNLEGVGGEIACCKHFNVYPDTSYKVTKMPKYDLITPKGSRVDVKTTNHRTPILITRINKQVEDCDVYVLVNGWFPDYQLIGWVESENFINQSNVRDLGHGDSYVMTPDKLRGFNEKIA